MLGPNRLLSHPFRPRADDDPPENGPGGDDSPAPSDGDGDAPSPSGPTSQAPPPEPTTTTPEPTSTPPPRPPPSSSSTSTTKPPSPPTSRPPPVSTSTRSTTSRPSGPTTQPPRPGGQQSSSTPNPGGNSTPSQASSDANPASESQSSLSGDQTPSSPALPTPTPNANAGGTRSISNNFGPAPSQGSDGSDGFKTDPASLGSDSQTGETGEPESTKKSGSKLVPILVPCLLVPIVVIALLVCLVKRSRRKHRIMVDEFTNRSMMFDGGTPLMLQRTHSYASSRYQPSQGHSVASHVDALRPVQASPTGAAYLTPPPPTPRSAKFRQSDDLDIKCAGRVESSASFSALYDAYDGTSETGLPYAQQQTQPQAQQQYQAPAAGPSYAPAAGPYAPAPGSYAPAPGPSYAPAPAPMSVPAPVTMSPTQRRNNFFNRPQFMRSSNIPPAAAATAPAPPPQTQQQQQFDPNWSRNPITGAPRLELPSLDFLQTDRAGHVETPSPVSAVWKSEDPFAGGLVDAPPLPSPPRVSSERRAARTRSVEQRLMLALAEAQGK